MTGGEAPRPTATARFRRGAVDIAERALKSSTRRRNDRKNSWN